MAKQPISLIFLAGFKGDGLKKAQKDLQGLGAQVDKLTQQTLKAGATYAMSKAWQGFTTVAESAITQARDLERNTAALGTVFGELAPRMERFSKAAVNVGLSQAEAAKASTFLGSVLKQSGFSLDETATQTERLVKLAADLALTYGYDVQEALLGMTALFRGEYDPIEKFGVAMKQSEINAALAAKNLDKLEGSERRLAEQQIRLEMLYSRSTDAQGAFARQSGTLAVEQEKLQASINNMLQQAGTPLLGVLADLAAAMVPIVEDLTPVLTDIFADLATKTETLVGDTAGLKDAIVNTASAMATLIEVAANLAVFIGKNLQAVVMLTAGLIGLRYTTKFIALVEVAMTRTATASAVAAEKVLAFRAALARTGIGIAIVAVGEALAHVAATADDYVFALDKVETASGSISVAKDEISALEAEQKRLQDRLKVAYGTDLVMYQAQLDEVTTKLNEARGAANNLNNISLQGLRNELSTSAGEANRFRNLLNGFVAEYKPELVANEPPPIVPDPAPAAKNYVKEFISGLSEEMSKQRARLQLIGMGASEGLIDSILSADGWMKIWIQIKSGTLSLETLQKQFFKTAAGAKELEDALKDASDAIDEQYAESIKKAEKAISDAQSAFDSATDSVNETRDSFSKFFEEFSVLPTTEREIGSFEASTISALDNIKGMLDSTLASLGDDFKGSYNKLLDYARKEMAELANIQRQRDDLAKKRSLAEALMADVQAATVSTGNIVGLFDKAKAAAEKVKATDVIAKTIEAGRGLKEFRVTVIRDIVDPLTTAADVVDGFKAVVDKTKTFISNLKTLKALGLDPQLFNQLVQAGVEAGGETAQALVDGGSDTLTEINSLFGELNSLGAELGEQTAQVMYGEGVDLTNGLIAGIAAMQADLEDQARTLASAFEITFNSMLETALDAALQIMKDKMQAAKDELAGILADVAAAKAAAAASIQQSVAPVVTPAAAPAAAAATVKAAEAVTKSASDLTAASKAVSSVAAKVSMPKTPTAGEMQALPIKPKAPLTPSMQAIVAADKKTASTITINVTANSRTQGTQAGQAVVSSLQKYIATSGNTSVTRLLK